MAYYIKKNGKIMGIVKNKLNSTNFIVKNSNIKRKQANKAFKKNDDFSVGDFQIDYKDEDTKFFNSSIQKGREQTERINYRSIKAILKRKRFLSIDDQINSLLFTASELMRRETNMKSTAKVQIIVSAQKQDKKDKENTTSTKLVDRDIVLNDLSNRLYQLFDEYGGGGIELERIDIIYYNPEDVVNRRVFANNELTDNESMIIDFLKKYDYYKLKQFCKIFNPFNTNINTVSNCVAKSFLYLYIGLDITENQYKWQLKKLNGIGLNKKENDSIGNKIKILSDFYKCKINVYNEIELSFSYGEGEEYNLMVYLNHCYPLTESDKSLSSMIDEIKYKQEKQVINKVDKIVCAYGSIDILFNKQSEIIEAIIVTFEKKNYKDGRIIYKPMEEESNRDFLMRIIKPLSKFANNNNEKIIYYTHSNDVLYILYKYARRKNCQIAYSDKNECLYYRTYAYNEVNFRNLSHWYSKDELKEYKESNSLENVEFNAKLTFKLVKEKDNFLMENYKMSLGSAITPSQFAKNLFKNNLNRRYDINALSKILEYDLRQNINLAGLNIFKRGQFNNIRSYDFSSSFPAEMFNYYPYGDFILLKAKDMSFDKNWFGMMKIKITKLGNNKYEILKLGYQWIPTFVFDQLYNDLLYDYEFRIIEVLHYKKKTDKLFYHVSRLYDTKKRYGNQLSKIILNSTYGFFGRKYHTNKTRIVNMKENKFDSLMLSNNVKEFKELENNDYLIKSEESYRPDTTNLILSIFINYYAKMKLLRLIHEIEEHGGNVYYSDTDSVYTDLKLEDIEFFNKYKINSGELGSLKLEGNYESTIFLEKKRYATKEYNGQETIKFCGYNTTSKYQSKTYDIDDGIILLEELSNEGESIDFRDFELMVNNNYGMSLDVNHKIKPDIMKGKSSKSVNRKILIR